jgi:predicted nucleotidyltransferase
MYRVNGPGRELDEDRKMMKLEEASAISIKDKGLLAEVKEVVQRFLPAAEVYLYGSVARGTHGSESDYDFLVVTDEPLTTGDEEVIWDAVFDVEMAHGVPISVQFCAKDEWQQHQSMPFYVEVRRDGIAL